mgnify:CR=1 FL=1
MLSWGDIESNAIAFARNWKDSSGNEKQYAQTFENEFLIVFGADPRAGVHEHPVINPEGVPLYIDYLLPGKILIEMKSKGESLVRAYSQAHDYARCLAPVEYPELLMVSDFEWFQVSNLRTGQTFKKFKLSQLKNHLRMFGILAGYTSEVSFETDIQVNTAASYKMAKLHDQLKENGYQGKPLEIYLVRLLFCLFAEDTGIFEKGTFEAYLKASKEDGSDLSARMMELFSILDTPNERRMSTLREELQRFRYINGELFSVPLPPASFDSKMRQTLIDCCDFDWSYISPAIFGAMFQGVMDEQQRREMGAHYTSEDNIMKVIKPLFLDDLWAEFDRMKSTKAELETFHNKIAGLRFLDPACGCGNFLIITYRELRLLEFEVLKMLHDNRQRIITDLLCRVSVDQYYGIEYEEFPCQIAQVGLLLMKHQMDKEVSNYFGMNMIDFPIKETATIVHGNALRIDWEKVISKDKLAFILGNPPFIGHQNRSVEQAEDMSIIFSDNTKGGKLDYVAAWYKKSIDYMATTSISAAFVSTNSICQGESVPILWPYLSQKGLVINFAYKTFVWKNEARGNAAVHCVIIGFSLRYAERPQKWIFTEDKRLPASRINGYLVEGSIIELSSRGRNINNGMPEMYKGSQATDGTNLLLSAEEYNSFIRQYPDSKSFVRKFVGSEEFINNIDRYCLWLPDVAPQEYRHNTFIINRLNKVSVFRKNSKTQSVRDMASHPYVFTQVRQPNSNYLLIPRVSSQRRPYIPIGFVEASTICSDSAIVLPDATLYLFGVLTSAMHMAWMRTVAGRLKSDFRYSSSVYNNFVFPQPTDQQKKSIEQCAQAVLEARQQHHGSSLADLYDPLTMPTDLASAHQHLDRAVEKAYGRSFASEEEMVAFLFERYAELVQLEQGT